MSECADDGSSVWEKPTDRGSKNEKRNNTPPQRASSYCVKRPKCIGQKCSTTATFFETCSERDNYLSAVSLPSTDDRHFPITTRIVSGIDERCSYNGDESMRAVVACFVRPCWWILGTVWFVGEIAVIDLGQSAIVLTLSVACTFLFRQDRRIFI